MAGTWLTLCSWPGRAGHGTAGLSSFFVRRVGWLQRANKRNTHHFGVPLVQDNHKMVENESHCFRLGLTSRCWGLKKAAQDGLLPLKQHVLVALPDSTNPVTLSEWRSGDRPAWRDSGSESQSGIREPQSQFRDWGFGIRIPKRDSRIPIPISGFGIRMPKRDSRIPIPISGFGIRDSNPQTGVANPNPNFGIRDSNPKAGVANPNPNFGIRDSNPKAGFANPNPNFGIRDSGFGIRDSNPKTGVVNLNPNFGIRDSNPKAGFANPESQFWDSGFECQSGIREPQSQFRDSGFGIRDSNPKAGFANPNSGFGIRDLGLANPHPDFGIWDSNPKARFC